MRIVRTVSLIALVFAVTLSVLSINLNPLFPIDDAYISFRYARNWAEGAGLVFNPNERVEANSNFLWTVLLGLMRRTGLTEPLGARLLGFVAVLLTSLLLLLMVRRRLPEAPGALALAVALSYVLLPGTIFHALSGMETVLTALLMLGAAAAVDFEGPLSRRSWRLGLILALISLNRPEGVVLLGFVLLACLIALFLSRESRYLAIVPFIASYAAIVLPFLVWRFSYYGSLVPNSLVAKGGTFNLPMLHAGIEYSLRFVMFYSPLLILSVVSFATARVPELLFFRLPVVCTYGFMVVLGGAGDGYPFTRYLYPLVPLLAVWSAEGLWAIVQTFERMRGRNLAWLFGFILAAVLGLTEFTLLRTEHRVSGMPFGMMDGSGLRAGLRRFFAQDYSPHDTNGPLRQGLGHHHLAAWLQAHTSPNQLLATHEIGIVPYYSRMRVLDLYGLASREIARSEGWPGQRAKPAFIASRRPDYLVLRLPADSLSMPLPIFNQEHRREDYEVVQKFSYWSTEILLLKRR